MQYWTINSPSGSKKIQLPSSWSEVTLEMFQRIVAIKGNSEEEKKLIELSILSGMPVSEFKNMPKSMVMTMVNHVGTYLNFETEFQPFKEFDIDGQVFVVPDWDYKEMTFGEWMDAKTISAIKSEIELSIYENAHTLIAVLCRKKGQPEYDSTEVEEVAILFKKLTMDKVFSIVNFFLQQKKSWLKNLDIFSTLLLNQLTEDTNTYQDLDIMERLLTLLDMEDLPNKDLLRQRVLKLRTLESV